MDLTEESLELARRGRDGPIRNLILSQFPVVWRIAHALAAAPEPARHTVWLVCRRGARQIDKFRDVESVERWFRHHTPAKGAQRL